MSSSCFVSKKKRFRITYSLRGRQRSSSMRKSSISKERKAYSALVKFTDPKSEHYDIAFKIKISNIRKSWFDSMNIVVEKTDVNIVLPVGVYHSPEMKKAA